MKVWNKRSKDVPVDAVYIGRPSIYGNPYSHLASSSAEYRMPSRIHAVFEYVVWLRRHPDLRSFLAPLRGRDLVCWCSPALCHGDVLLALANGNYGINPVLPTVDHTKCGSDCDWCAVVATIYP